MTGAPRRTADRCAYTARADRPVVFRCPRGRLTDLEKSRSVGRLWFLGTMGLLDEAIREHLELKRQHGADPSEVAREEHDALGSVDRDAGVPRAGPSVDEGEPIRLEGRGSPKAGETGAPEPSDAIQETAEIDMRTILEADGLAHEEFSSEPARAAESGTSPPRSSIDRTTWALAAEEDMSAWDLPLRARKLDRSPTRGRIIGGEIPAEGSFS